MKITQASNRRKSWRRSGRWTEVDEVGVVRPRTRLAASLLTIILGPLALNDCDAELSLSPGAERFEISSQIVSSRSRSNMLEPVSWVTGDDNTRA